MEQNKLLKVLLTMKCFQKRNVNVLLLEKDSFDMEELLSTRGRNSFLKKDYKLVNEIFNDFMEKKIFPKDDIKEFLSDFTKNDTEISIHDLSRIEKIDDSIKNTMEYLINNTNDKELNIVILNKNNVKFLKYLFRCVFINPKDEWEKILFEIQASSIEHLRTEETILKDFNSSIDKGNVSMKNKIQDFDKRLEEVKGILAVLKGKEPNLNSFVKRKKEEQEDYRKDDDINSHYEILNIVEPTEGFDDIIGLKPIKTMLSKLIKLYTEDVDKLKKHKIDRDKGFILYGEPGTGKTMLCKAFAKELNGIFIYLSMEQFISKKNDDMNINALFDELDLVSTDYPEKTIVVFLDEIDSLRGRGKSNHNNSYYDGFTNEMLYRIDNLPKNIMIIGATNNLETLDKAIVRKGRLGNKYEVKNNFKKEEVIQFTKDYFTSSKMGVLNKHATLIATMIYYMNGSEISNILNKIKQNYYFKDEKDSIKKIIVDTIYSEKYNLADYEVTEEDELTVAYHEAGHALAYMNFYGIEKLHEVSIYPTETALGFVSYKFDKQNVTKEDLKQRTIISLAGRYAERLITNNISTGASSDLESANKYIEQIVNRFGMGDVENYSKERNNLSDYMLTKMDREHEGLLKLYSKQTEELVNQNREFLDALAKELVKEKVLIDVFEKYNKLIKREI